MAAPREARADMDDNMFMNGLTDTAGIYSGNFEKEIAALENEAEDGLFGDFQGRVLRPNKKQPKSAVSGSSEGKCCRLTSYYSQRENGSTDGITIFPRPKLPLSSVKPTWPIFSHSLQKLFPFYSK